MTGHQELHLMHFSVLLKILQVLVSNNMACQLLGFPSNELHTMTLEDLIIDHKNGIQVIDNINNEAIAQGGGAVLICGKIVSNFPVF